MSLNNYYLKPYYPIQKIGGDRFIIGIPGTETYINTEFNDKNNNAIKHLLENGISEFEIESNEIYFDLFKRNMLISSSKLNLINTRNLMYFDFLNIDFNNDILSKNILIIGIGGGGSVVAFLLAQFGFKNITIVDDDIVEESDVIKTMIFRNEHIGLSKVNALRDILYQNFKITPTIIEKKINSVKSIADIIDKQSIDFVVKSADPNLIFRKFLNEVALNKQIPVIHMSYSFHLLNIGPLYVPGGSSCDVSMNTHITDHYGESFDFVHRKKLFEDKTIHPSVTFNINILGSIIFKEILFYLSDNKEYVTTIDNIVYFSPLSLKGYSMKLKCPKTCKCQIIDK